jgi:uncharacterized membrane protein YfcA
MTPAQALVVLIFTVVFALIGYRVGVWKGRPSLGALLGMFLGLIGVVIMLCVPKTQEARIKKETQRLAAEQEVHRRMGHLPD